MASSYKKLKEKHRKEKDALIKDIFTLIDNDNFVDVAITKQRWKMLRETEIIMMKYSHNDYTMPIGILSRINTVP
jgi:hypothetical protein